MGSPNREAVKVVLIETQYVKTDTTSFKSVVQSLTGKDACVSWIEKSSFVGNGKGINEKRKREAAALDVSSDTIDYNIVKNSVVVRSSEVEHGGNSTMSSSFLTKGMSFKDLDGMFLEMPPIEDLQCWLWDE